MRQAFLSLGLAIPLLFATTVVRAQAGIEPLSPVDPTETPAYKSLAGPHRFVLWHDAGLVWHLKMFPEAGKVAYCEIGKIATGSGSPTFPGNTYPVGYLALMGKTRVKVTTGLMTSNDGTLTTWIVLTDGSARPAELVFAFDAPPWQPLAPWQFTMLYGPAGGPGGQPQGGAPVRPAEILIGALGAHPPSAQFNLTPKVRAAIADASGKPAVPAQSKPGSYLLWFDKTWHVEMNCPPGRIAACALTVPGEGNRKVKVLPGHTGVKVITDVSGGFIEALVETKGTTGSFEFTIEGAEPAFGVEFDKFLRVPAGWRVGFAERPIEFGNIYVGHGSQHPDGGLFYVRTAQPAAGH